jgi:hypothetical protein
MDFTLENEIKNIVKNEFLKENYHSELVKITVNNVDKVFDIDENSEYILVSKNIDMPLHGNAMIQSANNFFRISALVYNDISGLVIEKFRGHNMTIYTRGIDPLANPYDLHFLKITPY